MSGGQPGGLFGSRRAGVHCGEGVARTLDGTLRWVRAWPGGSRQVMAVQLPSSGLRNATVGPSPDRVTTFAQRVFGGGSIGGTA